MGLLGYKQLTLQQESLALRWVTVKFIRKCQAWIRQSDRAFFRWVGGAISMG